MSNTYFFEFEDDLHFDFVPTIRDDGFSIQTPKTRIKEQITQFFPTRSTLSA